MPPYFNFFAAPFVAVALFFLVSIVVPGVFIWAGLKVLGKDRGVLRCGIANFAAFAVTAVISALLHFTPLAIFLPLIAFLIYLYLLKSLLDISFLEAFLATIIAGVILVLTAVVLSIIFGVWLLFFTPSPPMMHMKF